MGMIAYKKQSCVTGKLLKSLLNVKKKVSNRRTRTDFFLRWGNSDSFPVRTRLELNTREAVLNTTNKLKMITILKDSGIPVPEFSTDQSLITGDVYIRNRLGVTRFGSDFSPWTDLYFSKPIENKKREYRIHVFNSKIIAMYEKVPHDQENQPRLFKSHNCKFKLVNPEICRVDSVGQQLVIDAVNNLGLLFGGVDLIYTYDNNKPESERKGFVITEVNSAPGLNNVNAQRWIQVIKEYINDNISN
jgi:hypothetical protein